MSKLKDIPFGSEIPTYDNDGYIVLSSGLKGPSGSAIIEMCSGLASFIGEACYASYANFAADACYASYASEACCAYSACFACNAGSACNAGYADCAGFACNAGYADNASEAGDATFLSYCGSHLSPSYCASFNAYLLV